MAKRPSGTIWRIWLALVGASTLIIGTGYAMTQQSTRLSADDLPLAVSQTVKQQLDNGAEAQDIVPTLKTDLKNDTSTFVIITDASQHVLASSASLNGRTPLPPSGVFAYTTQHGTDHFTWQPQAGVRLATRVVSYGNAPNNGFIITGQSLKSYEDRINTYTWLALAGWVAVLAWSSLVLLLPRGKD